MMFKKTMVGLAVAGLTVTIAFAAGLFPDFPIVGGATYCAGNSSSATGTIIGLVTGCPNQVPAGPTILTGNEKIPADTGLGSGINPQTVLITPASLNALPYYFVSVPNNVTQTISPNVGSIILSPAAGTSSFATQTIQMPAAPIDGQQVRIASLINITSLLISPNTGQSVNSQGVLSPFAGQSVPVSVLYIYRAANTTWYKL